MDVHWDCRTFCYFIQRTTAIKASIVRVITLTVTCWIWKNVIIYPPFLMMWKNFTNTWEHCVFSKESVCMQLRTHIFCDITLCQWVSGWTSPDISKQHNACIIRDEAVQKEQLVGELPICLGLLQPRRWGRYDLSQCRSPLAQQHDIASLKTGILNNTAVRTSDLTLCTINSGFW